MLNHVLHLGSGTTATKDDSKRFANLIGPTDPKIDREVREILVTARVGLLLKASWFGNMATRLRLVNADEWCATAATDGRNFYYNSRFVKMLRPKEVEFLFGHEVLHCVYDHFGRRGDRDPQLWNVSNDYCVNADLKEHRVGEFITSVPCLYDAKYRGMSSEEVYDQLMENVTQISLDKMIDMLLDDHLDGDSGDGGGENSGKGRPQLTEEERQQIRDEIKEAMLAAAATVDGAGSIPAGVRRLIKELTEPQMNWREYLRMQIESTIKNDYTWMRTSRKGWHTDSILPGTMPEPAIDIVVFMDASGSMDEDQQRDCLSEIKGICETFPNFRLMLGSFDTQVYNVKQFTSDDLEDVVNYEVHGGGGTDFNCIFEYLKEENIEPKKLVVFTDGMPCGSWGDERYCDTLWIIHNNPRVSVPWGEHAHYEKAK